MSIPEQPTVENIKQVLSELTPSFMLWPVLPLDAPMTSGRVYPRALLEREMLRLKDKPVPVKVVATHGDVGLIGGAYNFHIDGNTVYAEVKLAKEYELLIEAGCNVCFSVIGNGCVAPDGTGEWEVRDNGGVVYRVTAYEIDAVIMDYAPARAHLDNVLAGVVTPDAHEDANVPVAGGG